MNLPIYPNLSATGRRVLAEADARDAAVYAELGMLPDDVSEYLRGMSTEEHAALLHDGLRWRWHCHCRDAYRSLVMASHAVSAALNWHEFKHMPPYADRYKPSGAYQRRVDQHGEYHGGPVHWATGRPAAEREVPEPCHCRNCLAQPSGTSFYCEVIWGRKATRARKEAA